MKLTERGRWLLVYVPSLLLMEAAVIWGAQALWGPTIFHP